MSIDKLKTKFFTGAWLTDVKHYFKKINEIIDYLNGNGTSGDGSYKVYTALLTQTVAAPIPTVLNNTLGFLPTYSYSSDGQFIINGVNFPSGKTAIISSGINNPGTISKTILSTTQILLFTYDVTGSSVNGLLEDSFIEIRIYN